jgi:NitT/TauT family transport system substrate-binding protein
MSAISAKPVIRISPNPPLFDLPVLVALREGLFERAGLDVSYAADYRDRESGERDVLKRQKESLFERGAADAFNVCEWGGIDRIERGEGRGRIGALRPAIAAQAILTFDPAIQTPRDLVDVPIAINEFTGSHYVTQHVLEGAIGKEHVNLYHVGAPEERLRQLLDGRAKVVTVMEPFISLGLKKGAHVVALSFYRGAEVLSADLTPIQREAYFTAIDQAVDLIAADFGKYAHLVTVVTDGALAPEELARNYGHYIRYAHAQRYAPDQFQQAYDWMQDRGFTDGHNTHDSLVVG